jgi:hypothetical protein
MSAVVITVGVLGVTCTVDSSVMVGVDVEVGVAVGVVVALGLGDALGLALALGLTLGDADGLALALGLALGLTLGDADGLALALGLTLGLTLGDADGEADGLAEGSTSSSSSNPVAIRASVPVSQLLLISAEPAGQLRPVNPVNGGMMSPQPAAGKIGPAWFSWPFLRVTESWLTTMRV